jgi:glucose dehydrogenase
MSRTPAQRKRAGDAFLEVGIWLLFFALLVPAGFVGYAIGHATSSTERSVRAPATHAAVAARAQTPWSLQNGDLFNTRRTRDSSITSANVSKLGVAWTMPLTAGKK